VFFLIFGIIFIAAISLVFMLLWNWLLPVLFGIKAIDYLQALGLLLLSKILFSGVGMRHGRHYGRHEEWHKKFHKDFDASATDVPKE
jgi:hypothetical protein